MFGGGVVMGVCGYALLGPNRASLDPQVQSGLILCIGALGAAMFAGLGAYWSALVAASTASNEGIAARDEARKLSRLQAKTDLVRRIATASARHASDVACQVVRRDELKGKPYEPLPPVGPTTAIEDALNELYALGFQVTADAGQELFNSLINLDHFVYADTEANRRAPFKGLTSKESFEFRALQAVQIRLKTYFMDVSLRDQGSDSLNPDGTLPRDFFMRHFEFAMGELTGRTDLVAPLMISTNGVTAAPLGAPPASQPGGR